MLRLDKLFESEENSSTISTSWYSRPITITDDDSLTTRIKKRLMWYTDPFAYELEKRRRISTDKSVQTIITSFNQCKNYPKVECIDTEFIYCGSADSGRCFSDDSSNSVDKDNNDHSSGYNTLEKLCEPCREKCKKKFCPSCLKDDPLVLVIVCCKLCQRKLASCNKEPQIGDQLKHPTVHERIGTVDSMEEFEISCKEYVKRSEKIRRKIDLLLKLCTTCCIKCSEAGCSMCNETLCSNCAHIYCKDCIQKFSTGEKFSSKPSDVKKQFYDFKPLKNLVPNQYNYVDILKRDTSDVQRNWIPNKGKPNKGTEYPNELYTDEDVEVLHKIMFPNLYKKQYTEPEDTKKVFEFINSKPLKPNPIVYKHLNSDSPLAKQANDIYNEVLHLKKKAKFDRLHLQEENRKEICGNWVLKMGWDHASFNEFLRVMNRKRFEPPIVLISDEMIKKCEQLPGRKRMASDDD